MATDELLSLITGGLFSNEPWESAVVPRAFFVHTSIVDKWVKIMNKMFTNSDWEMYEHILQIGSEQFEMRLIIVLQATKDQLNFLCYSIKNSQISFPWEENPTLFIKAANFNIMKKFIKDYNLQEYILKIEEKLGHSIYGDHPIKVFSFNHSVSAKLDIVHEFKTYCDVQGNSLFMAFGFPWQQSYFLQNIHLKDNFNSTLPIIFRHLATLNYANDLDILDLLSLRLAISDVRDPFESNPIKDEIDFMIKRVLVKLIKNNHLSIYKYFVAKNRKPISILIFYMAYEFQNLFLSFDMPLGKGTITLHDTFKLKEEIDVSNKLKERFNVLYRIDGEGFDKMSLSLLVDLIQLRNVSTIDLDTNYRWLNSTSQLELNRIISASKQANVHIHLRGENTYNFIEGLAAELKTITFDNCKVILHILKCKLNDYRIFDNSTVSTINIYYGKIDLSMLENLEQCDIEPRIFVVRCPLENTCRNWQLLNNLGKLSMVQIQEDEGTWLSMFEFIFKEIRKLNTNEFQFNSKLTFRILNNYYDVRMDLNKMKFTIDEQNSKLEIRDVDTNKIVDLYCKTRAIQQEEKPDYEFYE